QVYARVVAQRFVGGDDFECERLQRITGEDRHRLAKDDVAGRSAAAQIGVVHGWPGAMDQSGTAGEFYPCGRGVELSQLRAQRSSGGINEYGTQTLAAAEHGIAHRAMQFYRRLVLGWQHAREHVVGARAEFQKRARWLKACPAQSLRRHRVAAG